jgi:nucleoside-diphosphate-sugar epimerase
MNQKVECMHVFITGVSGYIGGAVAERLVTGGHRVSGLIRSAEQAEVLRKRGIEPVLGRLCDLTVIGNAARGADAVVNAASAEDSPSALTLVEALKDSGKPLLHTSGTSVVADHAIGEYSAIVYTENMPLSPLPERLLRVAVETLILDAAGRGVRSVVIRPSLIYGRGPGFNPHSHQLPRLVQLASERARPAHVGRGLNIWSNVHIDDVADLYVRAINDASPGSVFFAENGEASWKDMAIAVGKTLGIPGETEALSLEESLSILGIGAVTSFGSNSRVSAEKARRMLGWSPTGSSIWEDLKTNYYRTPFNV